MLHHRSGSDLTPSRSLALVLMQTSCWLSWSGMLIHSPWCSLHNNTLALLFTSASPSSPNDFMILQMCHCIQSLAEIYFIVWGFSAEKKKNLKLLCSSLLSQAASFTRCPNSQQPVCLSLSGIHHFASLFLYLHFPSCSDEETWQGDGCVQLCYLLMLCVMFSAQLLPGYKHDTSVRSW